MVSYLEGLARSNISANSAEVSTLFFFFFGLLKRFLAKGQKSEARYYTFARGSSKRQSLAN